VKGGCCLLPAAWDLLCLQLGAHEDALVVLKVKMRMKNAQADGGVLGQTGSAVDRSFMKDIAKEVEVSAALAPLTRARGGGVMTEVYLCHVC
jgi:hypothetical protein